MDRLVKVEAADVELYFRPGERCTATVKVISLIHTMPVAVKLTTTRPASYSFSPNFAALIQPLCSAVFTLNLLPTAAPPILSPPDSVLVAAALAPSLRRINSGTLRRFFSRPALTIFHDASLPILLIGPYALRSVLLLPSLQRDRLLSRIIQSCSPCELSSALPLAAVGGSAAKALLNAGADPNAGNAISLAVSAGNAEAVETLLKAGATDRPFNEAAAENRTDLINLLLAGSESGAWSDRADAEGRTPVHAAAARGALDALRLCLASGGDPNRTDNSGWTPLHYSAAGGHLQAAELLIISSEFDLRRALTREGKGKRRRTPLDLAVEKGHAQMYEILRPGGEVIYAARCGDGGKVAAAVRATGRVGERDQNGWTALHVAALMGRVEAVRELVESGAEVEAVDDAGYTPLRCAVEAGHTVVALLLVSCGARLGLKGIVTSKGNVTADDPVPLWESSAAAVSSAPIKNENSSITTVKSKGFESLFTVAPVADMCIF